MNIVMKQKLENLESYLTDRFTVSVVWIASIYTYGFIDLLTTYVGLYWIPGMAEKSPGALYLLETYGFGSLIFTKIAILALSYASYRMVENSEVRSYNIHTAIPYALLTLGIAATLNNIIQISLAAV